MTAHLRVLDTGVRPARWNIAATAALTELHRNGRSPDTLRFHRYPVSVLIGLNQVPAQAADLAYCRRKGIELARRVTGGGAVYMSPEILAWDLVVSRRALAVADLGDAAAAVCGAVAAGLREIGLPARFRPSNEIEVDGRRVSGASGFLDEPSLVYQGTVVIEADLADMAAALAFARSDLAGRMTTVADELGRVPDLETVERAIAVAIGGLLNRDTAIEDLSLEESYLAGDLFVSRYGTDEFVASADGNRQALAS